jgi:hypothetical protein
MRSHRAVAVLVAAECEAGHVAQFVLHELERVAVFLGAL